jgi:hypothetical protein
LEQFEFGHFRSSNIQTNAVEISGKPPSDKQPAVNADGTDEPSSGNDSEKPSMKDVCKYYLKGFCRKVTILHSSAALNEFQIDSFDVISSSDDVSDTVKASNFGPHRNFGPFFCKSRVFFE